MSEPRPALTEPFIDAGMFTPDGDKAVAVMVNAARHMTGALDEAAARAWVSAQTERIAADTGIHPYCADLAELPGETRTGMSEIRDTAVREAIAVELDGAWQAAYGHGYARG